MKDTKKIIVTAITLASAFVAFVSASAAICMFEGKTDIKYVLKKKAKKAIRGMENKIENNF
jgi:hypothetical protein